MTTDETDKLLKSLKLQMALAEIRQMKEELFLKALKEIEKVIKRDII